MVSNYNRWYERVQWELGFNVVRFMLAEKCGLVSVEIGEAGTYE